MHPSYAAYHAMPAHLPGQIMPHTQMPHNMQMAPYGTCWPPHNLQRSDSFNKIKQGQPQFSEDIQAGFT